jgi:hypothetical protein
MKKNKVYCFSVFRLFFWLSLFLMGLFFLLPVSMEANTQGLVTEASAFTEDVTNQIQSPRETNADQDFHEEDDWNEGIAGDEIKITEVFYFNMLINLVAVILLIMLVYYPGNRKPDQIFTFIIFNIIIFVITYVLNQVKFSMGAAFGLFAVFTMLRYRTRTITMKDMTYLFIFIALGLINAVQLRYDVMLVLNVFVILVTWVMDSNLIFKQESSKSIQYDQIDMIRPENHQALINDLRKRTGLHITRFEIRRVNFLRDTVRLTVYYRERPGGIYARMGNGGQQERDEEMDV